MTVQLYKQEGTYVDKKDGKEKPYVNFSLKCGDKYIPIEVKYFPNDKCEGRDPGFSGKKEVLKAFADVLPDKS